MNRSGRDKTVIFDLGNVVLDWNVDRILKSLNLEARETGLLRNELFAHRNWLDLDHGKVSESTVVSMVCERSGLGEAVVEDALSAARNSLVPIDESLALMEEISSREIDMYCLSNMSRETYAHIRDCAFFDLFSGIVISGIEGCMKPGDDIFLLTLERFGLDPSSTLFIDDSLQNVETARRLGIDAFHFKRSQSCYRQLRKLILE